MEKPLVVDEDIHLELADRHHKDALFALVNGNREYLRQWLPWLDMNTSVSDTEAFLETAIAQYQAGEGPQYAVFFRNRMCGVCGFHRIDRANHKASIGYWLAREFSGRGIMTRAVWALLETGFRHYGLNKLEIQCATENIRSRKIPERLGFRFDGILRQNEYLYGSYVDHAVYSLLASEYRAGEVEDDSA